MSCGETRSAENWSLSTPRGRFIHKRHSPVRVRKTLCGNAVEKPEVDRVEAYYYVIRYSSCSFSTAKLQCDSKSLLSNALR